MSGTLAITMAGFGSRFKNAGYNEPKYQINVLGRPLFDWSMLATKAFHQRGWQYAFAVRKADRSMEFIKKRCDFLGVATDCVLELDQPTDGQATTARLLAEISSPDAPFAVFNIDTYVRPGAMSPDQIDTGAYGWIPCFYAPGDSWSFARTNASGEVMELREKKRISPNATVGFYWFRSARLFLETYETFFLTGGEEKGERYIAPMYNQLIHDQKSVQISILDMSDVGMLGTPEQVEHFKEVAAQELTGIVENKLDTPHDDKM